jgi:hypothetical protein
MTSNKMVVVVGMKYMRGDIPPEVQQIMEKLTQGYIDMVEKLDFKVLASAGFEVDAFEWQPNRSQVMGEDVLEAMDWRQKNEDAVGDQPLRLNLFLTDEFEDDKDGE